MCISHTASMYMYITTAKGFMSDKTLVSSRKRVFYNIIQISRNAAAKGIKRSSKGLHEGHLLFVFLRHPGIGLTIMSLPSAQNLRGCCHNSDENETQEEKKEENWQPESRSKSS